MKTRRIVAISGSGRTGSTLLSLLLSQHSATFNLGQLRDLWSAWLDDAPCSCGASLRRCPVYGVVVPRAFGAEPEAALREMRDAMKAFFRAADRIRDWSDPHAVQALGPRHTAFLEPLATVLGALQDVTGASTFIDASKSPEMALAFACTAGTDLRVLNLVRDPRAVAVSWHRKRGGALAGWDVGRTWVRRQRQLGRWSRALDGQFAVLRYEDFAADARAAIARIEHWAGLDPMPGVFASAERAQLSWASQHLYPPANERVLAERATSVVIRPADEWRDPRHRWQHRLALVATHPEGARYVRDAATPA